MAPPHTGGTMKTYGLLLPLLIGSAVACGPAASDGTTDGSSSTGDTTGDSDPSVSVTMPMTMTTDMTVTGMTATDPTTETTAPTTDTTETTVDPDTSATGTTDPETTTEAPESSGTETTSAETTTGGEPGFYGPCDFSDPENPTCPGDETCLVVDFGEFAGQHWCGLPCEDDATDCPESPNGDALVECSGLGLCALDCEDTECPEGMECNPIGSGDRCVWPAAR